MATIYPRSDSSCYWIKWRNPQTNKNESFSTGFRLDDPQGKAKATKLKIQHELKEVSTTDGHNHPFSEWVPRYLETSFKGRTLTRYKGTWKILTAFLNAHNVTTPNQLTRPICHEYVPWRTGEKSGGLSHHQNSTKGTKVCRNTAITEVKVLGKIMHEAMEREWIAANPCVRLGLPKDPHREKDELTDEHVKIIQDEIERLYKKASRTGTGWRDIPIAPNPGGLVNANFLKTSFEIARLQGIRLSETYFSLKDDVDWVQKYIRVHAKGHGRGKVIEEVGINPNLLPLLKRLRAEGKTHTYEKPSKPMSLVWFIFFDRLRKKYPDGMFDNVSFHSTRVTVVTRLGRAGVPENVVMKTVLHANTTVHRVYRRVKHEELAPYWDSVGGAAS